MAHENLEQLISQKVADKEIPGCVLTATNRDGSFTYTNSFGTKSPADPTPLDPSTIMWIASCTKLMTSIACLQLVERGLASLDAPIYDVIPELQARTFIKSISPSGVPQEEPHTVPMTLRHLLTHTSGISYDAISPPSIAWLTHHGKDVARAGTPGKVLERYASPLIFEPGTSWAYGAGLDFAGLFVERVAGVSLEEFLRENLWARLGIKDATFFPSAKRPDLAARRAGFALRDLATGVLSVDEGNQPFHDGEGKEVEDCFGGQGVFTSPEEYLKVLKALLTSDEEEGILKKDTVEEFFKPQLGEGSQTALNLMLQDERINNAMGATPGHIKKNWGLGGLLLEDGTPGGLQKGTMIWGGLPNLVWFVDRKTGLCGLYAGQLFPTWDAVTAKLVEKFENAMYERYEKSRAEKSRV